MRSPPHSIKQGAGRRRYRQAHPSTKSGRKRNMHSQIASRAPKGSIGARGWPAPLASQARGKQRARRSLAKGRGEGGGRGQRDQSRPSKEEKRGLADAYRSMHGLSPPPPPPFPPAQARKWTGRKKGAPLTHERRRRGMRGGGRSLIPTLHVTKRGYLICRCRWQHARLKWGRRSDSGGGQGQAIESASDAF